MIELINQHAKAEFDAGDDAAVLAILNAKSITKQDDHRYTWAWVADTVGPVLTEQLRQVLESQGLKWVVYQLGGTGMQVSHPLVLDTLQKIIASGLNLQPLIDAVIIKTSPATELLGRDATLEDIAQCRTQLATDALQREWASQFNEAIGPALAVGDRTEIAKALRTAADALEAG